MSGGIRPRAGVCITKVLEYEGVSGEESPRKAEGPVDGVSSALVGRMFKGLSNYDGLLHSCI